MQDTKLKLELNQLSSDDLKEKLNETRRELFGIRLNAASAHVKDYSLYRKLRKNIARILTIMGQKQEQ